jgi:hypothetical protein
MPKNIQALVELFEIHTDSLEKIAKSLTRLHEWCMVLSQRIERLEELTRTNK